MSTTRQIKLGQLEQLRKKITQLEAQAANSCVVIEMKTISIREDLSKLDIDAILQASTDLHTAVTLLRKAKQHADELNAGLYD